MALRDGRPKRGARERLLTAAVDLFAEQGVSGTTLQMIADRLGVTKAAVYHQFQAKEGIVLAVIAPALDNLATAVAAAEARPTPAARRETMLSGLVNLVVDNRRVAAIIHADPAVSHLVREQPAMQTLIERMNRLLVGSDPDTEQRVILAMIGGSLMIVGREPALAGIDDDDLRRHLMNAARRILKPSTRTRHAGQPTPEAE
jgi:AcrR family transcriptional regulator